MARALAALLGILTCALSGCGEAPGPDEDDAPAAATEAAPAEPEASPPAATPPPPKPEGVFRLVVHSRLTEGAPAPEGFRILRLPPIVADLPTGAQVNRSSVQRGQWRDAPPPGQPLIIDLEPTEEAARDRWKVIALLRNDPHQFLYAHQGYAEAEIGTSPLFALDPAGGELRVDVEVRTPLRVQPVFDGEGPFPPMRFDFRYGPIASEPQRVRGTWPGRGPLPFLLTRYAIGREAELALELDGWPQPRQLGTEETALIDGTTEVPFGRLDPVGPLRLTVGPADGPAWAGAEVLGGFLDAEGLYAFAPFGETDARGVVAQEGVHLDRYHFTARAADGDAILLGWVAHNGDAMESTVQHPPVAERGMPEFPELPEADDWQGEVWSFWGSLLVGRTPVRPGQALTLPHAGEMRHQGVLRRWDAEAETTQVHLYLECEWDGGTWHFHRIPSELEVTPFADVPEIEARLSIQEAFEPGQMFPPPRWQLEPGRAEAVDWFPLRFRGGLTVHGLPEAKYSVGLFGSDPDDASGPAVELATMYRVAD